MRGTRARISLVACILAACTLPGCSRTAKAPANYADEEQWIVGQIAADICEMVAFSKNPNDTPETRVDVKPAPSAPGVLSFELSVPSWGGGQKASLSCTDYLWNAQSYAPVCQYALNRFGFAPGGDAQPADSGIMMRLLDAGGVLLEKESERISGSLSKDMLHAGSHEEAALLLATLALRESSRTFDDSRALLSRATAHLALARVLRGTNDASLCATIADIAVQVVCMRQRAAVNALEKASSLQTTDRAFKPWLNVLRMRATSDWRQGKITGHSTLLEKLTLFRALCESVNSEMACETVDRRKPENIPDWSWIVLAHKFGVKEGHLFGTSGLDLTMRECADVWRAYHGSELASSQLAAALNEIPGRCISQIPGEHAAPRVIDWGCWASFYQRHFMHVVRRTDYFMRELWGDPDTAAAFEKQMTKIFASLDLFPVNGEYWSNDEASYKTWFTRGAAVCTAQPWRMGFMPWRLLRVRSPYAPFPGGLPDEVAWFNPPLPFGTAYDLFNRLPDHPKLMGMTVEELDALADLAPYDVELVSTRCKKKYGSAVPDTEVTQAYGPLADYNAEIMMDLANRAIADPGEYVTRMQKLCDIFPDYYFDLAQYLEARGNRTATASAYENGQRLAHDRVLASNNGQWLVDYYLDEGRTNDAITLADEVADVYSSVGVETKARLLERLGKYDEAEEWFRHSAERYNNETSLMTFYERHPDEKSADGTYYRDKVAAYRKAIFPDGMEKVTLADFKTTPRAGVLWAESNDSSLQFGLAKGVILVALDGYRVANLEQYDVVRALKKDPHMMMIAWVHGSYQEINAVAQDRRFGCRLETYRQ